jgi:hypothetical protein
MVLSPLPHDVEERYPRRQGDEGGIPEEGWEGAACRELTERSLPFGYRALGVKTRQGVWEVMHMRIGMTHAGRCRHDQQDGHPHAPDA